MLNESSITVRDYDCVRKLILEELGIHMEEGKNYFLKSRIESRMEATHCKTFEEYHRMLLVERESELIEFLEAITINETYFFRDFPQLQGFAEEVLPPYLETKSSQHDRSLRVWSAACSVGAEPYTLAIILREMIDDYKNWNVSIDATDIDSKALRHARTAIYEDRYLRDVPSTYRETYFTELSKGGARVHPDIVSPVHFHLLNLMDRINMRRRRSYDFIFCRNVLIYFHEDTARQVVSSFYDSLNPGGYLFLGSSESVGRLTSAFELERRGRFLCYRKPLSK